LAEYRGQLGQPQLFAQGPNRWDPAAGIRQNQKQGGVLACRNRPAELIALKLLPSVSHERFAKLPGIVATIPARRAARSRKALPHDLTGFDAPAAVTPRRCALDRHAGHDRVVHRPRHFR
jgi:hypothetical protein